MGLTDDVPLKYTVTIRGIYTTVEKGKVPLIEGHPVKTLSCSYEEEKCSRRGRFTTVEKGNVSLVDGHSPHPSSSSRGVGALRWRRHFL